MRYFGFRSFFYDAAPYTTRRLLLFVLASNVTHIPIDEDADQSTLTARCLLQGYKFSTNWSQARILQIFFAANFLRDLKSGQSIPKLSSHQTKYDYRPLSPFETDRNQPEPPPPPPFILATNVLASSTQSFWELWLMLIDPP